MKQNRNFRRQKIVRALALENLEGRALLAFDFGDAPDTGTGSSAGNYHSLSADGGPSHNLALSSTTLYLGTGVDGEANALPNLRAVGDDTLGLDDENGIVDPARDLDLTVGTNPSVRVRATNVTGSAGLCFSNLSSCELEG